MMTVVENKNINLEKERLIFQTLKDLMEKDIENGDLKSYEYHLMALKDTEENIERLENKILGGSDE